MFTFYLTYNSTKELAWKSDVQLHNRTNHNGRQMDSVWWSKRALNVWLTGQLGPWMCWQIQGLYRNLTVVFQTISGQNYCFFHTFWCILFIFMWIKTLQNYVLNAEIYYTMYSSILNIEWDSNFRTLNFRCCMSWTARKLTNAWVINSVIDICIFQVSITVFKEFFRLFHTYDHFQGFEDLENFYIKFQDFPYFSMICMNPADDAATSIRRQHLNTFTNTLNTWKSITDTCNSVSILHTKSIADTCTNTKKVSPRLLVAIIPIQRY